jgi:hypothetical protein
MPRCRCYGELCSASSFGNAFDHLLYRRVVIQARCFSTAWKQASAVFMDNTFIKQLTSGCTSLKLPWDARHGVVVTRRR